MVLEASEFLRQICEENGLGAPLLRAQVVGNEITVHRQESEADLGPDHKSPEIGTLWTVVVNGCGASAKSIPGEWRRNPVRVCRDGRPAKRAKKAAICGPLPHGATSADAKSGANELIRTYLTKDFFFLIAPADADVEIKLADVSGKAVTQYVISAMYPPGPLTYISRLGRTMLGRGHLKIRHNKVIGGD